MKIILAQGNPGSEYPKTRHNVGFLAVDTLAEKLKTTWLPKTKFKAQIAECNIAGEKVLLVKPTTFYNETGNSAHSLIDFYKLNPIDDLLVIHDDLSLPFGTIRVREKGSDAGNNGIKSINNFIGQDYKRIRIGIYNELREKMDDADFVLSNFNKDESEQLEKTIIPKVIEIVEKFCNGNIEITSHKS